MYTAGQADAPDIIRIFGYWRKYSYENDYKAEDIVF